MDILNGDHAVSRQRQQELLQVAKNCCLARDLRESRRTSQEYRRGRKVLRLVAILAPSP